jgi:hypothetical protein
MQKTIDQIVLYELVNDDLDYYDPEKDDSGLPSRGQPRSKR